MIAVKPVRILQFPDGGIAKSRPLCVYPERAEFLGGDPDEAASYACRSP